MYAAPRRRYGSSARIAKLIGPRRLVVPRASYLTRRRSEVAQRVKSTERNMYSDESLDIALAPDSAVNRSLSRENYEAKGVQTRKRHIHGIWDLVRHKDNCCRSRSV